MITISNIEKNKYQDIANVNDKVTIHEKLTWFHHQGDGLHPQEETNDMQY